METRLRGYVHSLLIPLRVRLLFLNTYQLIRLKEEQKTARNMFWRDFWLPDLFLFSYVLYLSGAKFGHFCWFLNVKDLRTPPIHPYPTLLACPRNGKINSRIINVTTTEAMPEGWMTWRYWSLATFFKSTGSWILVLNSKQGHNKIVSYRVIQPLCYQGVGQKIL